MTNTSLSDFYRRNGAAQPDGLLRDIGHFNIFESEKLFKKDGSREMPYSRRAYYKISWLNGNSRAEYADKVINIQGNGLLFATPKIPYHWIPENSHQNGIFCIFTPEFLGAGKTGIQLDELPIFQSGQTPIFELSMIEQQEIEYIFRKMLKEIDSDYRFKYDLLRNLVLELIHYGQKLQPMTVLTSTHNASERISSLFFELLERQFPLDSSQDRLNLRSAKDYADRLAVHVNHLNKVLKDVTGNTTTRLISNRIVAEAKMLLTQTDLNIVEIAYALGFDGLSQFSNFFKKETTYSPSNFRTI